MEDSSNNAKREKVTTEKAAAQQKTTKTKKLTPKQSELKEKKEKINFDIAKLRRKKKEAIKNGNFTAAEDIDREISELNESFAQDSQKAEIDEYRTRLLEIINACHEKLVNSEETAKNEEKETRIKINSSFEELQKQHRAELVNLGAEHENIRLRERERTIPDYESLKKQAEHAAMLGNYEAARSLSSYADELAAKDIEERLKRLDEEFEESSRKCISAQRESIILLTKRLESELKAVANRKNARNKQIMENLEAGIVGHYTRNGQGSTTFEAITVQECNNAGFPVPKTLGNSVSVKKNLLKPSQA